MTLSSAEINDIVRALQESDWDEASVTVGDVNIALARNGATLSPTLPPVAPLAAAPALSAAVPAPPAAAVQAPAGGDQPTPARAAGVVPAAGRGSEDVVVTATSVGVYWEAPEPGADPFVSVGSSVAQDDVVCIIEIMKLMNHVPAGVSGTVTEILVENGQAVERGTPLLVIRPQGA